MKPSSHQSKPITVYLADDHPAILDGLEYTLLEADFEIVGRSRAYTKCLKDLTSLPDRAQLLITDLSFPDGSGIELVRQAKKLAPEIKALVHTGYASYLAESLQAGADGYMLKSEDARLLLRAIEAIMEGKRFLSPEAGTAVLELMQRSELELDFQHAVFTLLTEKERVLLPHLHLENQQIVDLLGIPLRTLEGQMTQIRKKLNKTRLEIVRLVARTSRTERP